MSVGKYKQMSSVEAAGERIESAPHPVGGRRRSRRRGGNAEEVVGRGGNGEEAVLGRGMEGGAECGPGEVDDGMGGCKPAEGGRRMTRKQRAAVKKVARALKAANKKAFRLAKTLKKKLGRGRA
jgi:hypothetical protein